VRAAGGTDQEARFMPRLGDAAANQVEAQVEYHKSEQTSFRVMADDVAVRSESHKSFDLLWRLPGYGAEAVPEQSGIVCGIGQAHYELENVSDYILYIRLQRPLGYKASPSSIAMWEPISPHANTVVIELKPHDRKKIVVNNTGTMYMTPRHVNLSGGVYCHLMSMSLYRDMVNFHGNPVKPESVALTVDVDLRFRVNDGQVGPQKGFVVSMFPDSVRMDEVDPGPSVETRVEDLSFEADDNTAKRHPCDFIRFRTESGRVKAFGIRYVPDKKNGSGNFVKGILSLDRSVMWQFRSGILAYPTNGAAGKDSTLMSFNAITWDSTAGAFVLASPRAVVNSSTISSTYIWADSLPSYTYDSTPVLRSSEMLTPMSHDKQPKFVGYKIKKPSKPLRSRISDPLLQASYQLSGIDTILDSVVIVVDVIRVIASFAAAVGFLAEFNGNVVGSH
ncbi:hypothetical protein, partial [Leptospira sp. Pond_2020]|uniref:hypothetical protein n=1 Tax=Leptospira sp. Pond_2020 TaxID=2846916 RepID=UPI001E2F2406